MATSSEPVDNQEQFPYSMRFVPFARHSVDSQFSDHSSDPQLLNKRMVIVGGYGNHDSDFLEIFLEKKSKKNDPKITYKSFVSDYKKLNATMNIYSIGNGCTNGSGTHSFLVQNGKYLIIFELWCGYNVYDIENDKWLLEENDPRTFHYGGPGQCASSKLINDEIIIMSIDYCLIFYYVGEKYINQPFQLYQYNSKEFAVDQHQMCCIGYTKRDDKQHATDAQDDNRSTTFELKLMLLGGEFSEFLDSFVMLDVSFNLNKSDKPCMEKVEISETSIKSSDIKCSNFDKSIVGCNKELFRFGAECVVNQYGEPIIMIIGGKCSGENQSMSKSVLLYNTISNEMTFKNQILPFTCSERPATMLCSAGNQKQDVIVMQNKSYVIYNVKINFIKWETERVIWIGFHKNKENVKCCMGILPKDVVHYVLRFVGFKVGSRKNSLTIDI